MQNKTPHVIVCDDDAELNSFMRSHFKLDGYITHQALSAQEGIDKLAELGDTIDAITVNGKIASDRSTMLILNVKRMNKNVKVFVLADKGLSEDKIRIMDYGADEFAIKPISMESLINKVNLQLVEVEQGVEPQRIAVIYDAEQALELYHWLIMSAEKEIKVVFPTTNALIRQDKAGILFLLQEAAAGKKCQVKVLMPNDELIRNFIPDNSGISTRFIDQEESGKATILIVDNKTSLVMELKDDSKKTFHEAIGLSTYSNSKAGVLSYVSMFESLWKQTELYEKLKSHEKMQKEFINIAAHELRTPIVPILNLSELLYSNAKGEQRQVQEEQQKEMLEIILRNANRLHQLAEDILDVTRIESQTLRIRKERFNLNDAIVDIVEHYGKQIANSNVKVMYEPGEGGIILVEADRRRLIQVISNLLDNAIKFTEEGTVTVTTMERKDDGDGAGGGEAEVVVSIKDTGTGIDPELMPRLFTKFATKSYRGTGLGLYISKSIIEAHGGRMWAENNKNGSDTKHNGATFYFTLPVMNMNLIERGEKEEEARLVTDQ